MTRRPQPAPSRKVGVRSVALLFSLFVAMATVLAGSPAGAAGATDKAQISLTGLVDSQNPAGGSQLGIHPGDSIKFSASAAPTAKVKDLADSLGLSSLLDGLLGSSVKFQVTADFHKLPGGQANTKLSGSTSKTFTFANAGTYSFTWTADKITVGLLGTSILPINLDGNQAKKAGVELNAKNQYVGTIVVAKNPPKGGISIQLPTVSVQPKLPVVGTLPKITIPGVALPTIKVEVPKLSIPKTSDNSAKGGGKKSTKPGSGLTYTPPGLSIPAQVVPGAGVSEIQGSNSGGGGGAYTGLLPDSNSQVGNVSVPSITNQSGSNTTTDPKTSAPQNSTGKGKTIDLASESPAAPSSSLPILLAIAAIIALALVAGTYARLFLLRKN